ncbi:MAG: hypothetical protein HDT46_09885 [Ruminococcaceae bacterium]|nr:hypothetical protein [Oscillospiraceae bacterium]
MRYKINSAVAYTRKMKVKVFLRWLFYSLALVLLYSIMSCGAFKLWQPYMIFALAIGVSMKEQEFSSSIFGIFCGFMLDISSGTLFGFFAVCVMPCCFITSLFSRNLIKVNILNHLLFTSGTTLFSFSLYYLFNYVIWSADGRWLIVTKILLPSFIATLITAPLIYWITKFIASKFGLEQNENLDEAVEEAVDKAEEKRKSKRIINVDKKNKYIKDLEKENSRKRSLPEERNIK